MKLRWFPTAVGTEGAPIVVADFDVYRTWGGAVGTGDMAEVDRKYNPFRDRDKPISGSSDYDRIVLEGGFRDPADVVAFGDQALGLIDTDGGGPVDIGCNDREVLIVMCDGDYEDDPKRKSALLKAIEARKYDEFLAGELSLKGPLVIADSAIVGNASSLTKTHEPASIGANRFCVPRAPGRYLLLEGKSVDGGWEAHWCRLVPSGRKVYARRPTSAEEDPVEGILGRISFATDKEEARALESALELINLGRPELALDLCAKASPQRRVLAQWTRVIALAALADTRTATEAIALAESWLLPADSSSATNQMLPRGHVLRALDAALKVAGQEQPRVQSARTRVAAAPEPVVFVADGDSF